MTSTHILMGAINKETNKYEYPRIATKENSYKCPDCDKDVILRKGNVRVHHFAHAHIYTDDKCKYYNNPGESQIHKDAKNALKLILETFNIIILSRNCNKCKDIININIEKQNDNFIVQKEYSFNFNDSKKIADIAYLENDTIKYIFEVCYKHKTDSYGRPEPWFEINAEDFLNKINTSDYNDNIKLSCIRSKKCENCIKKELEEVERRRIRELEEVERQRIKELEQKRQKELIVIKKEKSKEIMDRLRFEHKKCSKCKYERCKKCVDKLWKKHYDVLNNYLANLHL